MHPFMLKTRTLLIFHRAFHIKRTSSICSKKSILLLFYLIQQQTSAQCKVRKLRYGAKRPLHYSERYNPFTFSVTHAYAFVFARVCN